MWWNTYNFLNTTLIHKEMIRRTCWATLIHYFYTFLHKINFTSLTSLWKRHTFSWNIHVHIGTDARIIELYFIRTAILVFANTGVITRKYVSTLALTSLCSYVIGAILRTNFTFRTNTKDICLFVYHIPSFGLTSVLRYAIKCLRYIVNGKVKDIKSLLCLYHNTLNSEHFIKSTEFISCRCKTNYWLRRCIKNIIGLFEYIRKRWYWWNS